MKCRHCNERAVVIIIFGPDRERVSRAVCFDHANRYHFVDRREVFPVRIS